MFPFIEKRTLGCALALLCACHAEPAKEAVLIAGSSTLQGYLQPLAAEFTKLHPNLILSVEGGGTKAGVIALKHGACDIAGTVMAVQPDEDDEQFKDHLIARDAIAVVVNPKNPLSDISLHQLEAIYEGGIVSWKEVGGADAPITVLTREKGSHTLKSFGDLVLHQGDPLKEAKVANKSAGMLEAVLSNPNAIGYVAMHNIKGGVKALRVEGVEINRLTILSGRYPLARSFYLAVYQTPIPAADAFINFVLGPHGQRLLSDDGLLAVRPQE